MVIDGRAVETPPMSAVNLLEGLSRTVVYMTYSQLTALVMPPAPGKSQCQLVPMWSHLGKSRLVLGTAVLTKTIVNV